MKTSEDEVNFDDYAERYENLLKDQLAFFAEDRDYFSEYKVALAAKHIDFVPKSVLDFGCGIGLLLPFLKKYFSSAEINATDLSRKSLEKVSSIHSYAKVVPDAELKQGSYDLIFVSGVFHHVETDLRKAVGEKLSSLLTPNGRLVVFEHNPYNPVTRYLVATCPFDQDAVLMSLREMKKLLSRHAGMKIDKAEYCLFFPPKVKFLKSVECLLGRVPMGGQYFVVAEK